MNNVNKFIKEVLSTRGLKLECPHCEEAFTPRQGKLFDVTDGPNNEIQRLYESMQERTEERRDGVKERGLEITEERKLATEKLNNKPESIKVTTHSVNFGQIAEKILPSFPNFPHHTLDCRALFDPIDYIIFNGLRNNGKISSINFTDVKTGQARLNKRQKEIKEAIERGNVSLQIGRLK